MAFPEAEFNTNDKRQLAKICKLIAFFDGAVPIKDFLNVSLNDVSHTLNEMSDKIDIPTSLKEIRYIKDIYDAIEDCKTIDMVYPRLNQGKRFTLSPYMLKRFNGKWFVLGRIAEENPFDWTVIPLAAIEMIAENRDNIKYYPSSKNGLKELKNNIQKYYSNVMGFHVPTKEKDKDKVPRHLDPDKLEKEIISLRFVNEGTIRFLRENPLHSSQKIDKETGILTLELVINPLLIQKILGYGPDIEVLSPQSLRDDIQKRITKMMDLYNK